MSALKNTVSKELRQPLQKLSDMIYDTHNDPSCKELLAHVQAYPALLGERLVRASFKDKQFAGAPLLNALMHFDIDASAVAKLLELGAPVEARNSFDGSTPLFWAVAFHSWFRDAPRGENLRQVCHLLLEAGARCDVMDNNGTDLLQVSKGLLAPDLLKELLARGAPVNRRDADGTPLLSMVLHEAGNDRWRAGHMDAAYNESYNTSLRLFISACPDVNPDVRLARQTPLALALNAERTDLADLLVARGARWQGSWDEGSTLMHVVTTVRGVDWLLEKDASLLEARDARGRTPLYRLCETLLDKAPGHEDAVKTVPHLIRLGADLDAPDFQGRLATTPLRLLHQVDVQEIKDVLRPWQSAQAARQVVSEALSPAKAQP